MTDINKKILEMIINGATANEISNELGITNKQLFNRLNNLKNKGYDFYKKYFYDGEILYGINRQFDSENKINIITKKSDDKFEAILISDLHLANEHDRLDLLYEVYNFCVKNNIHIILNCGDLIDGFLGPDKKKFNTYEEQINYVIKKYPFDKNILNFLCLGNHDLTSLSNSGQDLEKILNMKRHDIISVGYGMGKVNIKNDQIIMCHPKTQTKISENISTNRLILFGHTHRMKSELKGSNELNIYLPSLSDLDIGEKLPGMVKVNIYFKKGFFENALFEQYIFYDKLYKVNEMNYNLIKGKNINSMEKIQNEENRIPYDKQVKIKKLIY